MVHALRLIREYDALWLTLVAWAILGANAFTGAFLYGGSDLGLTIYVAVAACAVAVSAFAFIRALRWRKVARWRCIAGVLLTACSWICWAFVAFVSVTSASRCC